MADEPETTDVTVTVDTPEPPAAPETDGAPDVVVVNAGDSDGGNSDATVDLAARVGALEARIAALEPRVEDAEETAEDAEAEAAAATDLAVETAIAGMEASAEIAEDVAEETVEEIEDEPPVKVHWMHRPARALFGGDN